MGHEEGPGVEIFGAHARDRAQAFLIAFQKSGLSGSVASDSEASEDLEVRLSKWIPRSKIPMFY